MHLHSRSYVGVFAREGLLVVAGVAISGQGGGLFLGREVDDDYDLIAVFFAGEGVDVFVVAGGDLDELAAVGAVPEGLVVFLEVEEGFVEVGVGVIAPFDLVFGEELVLLIHGGFLAGVDQRHAVEGGGEYGESFVSLSEATEFGARPGVFIVVAGELHLVAAVVGLLFFGQEFVDA